MRRPRTHGSEASLLLLALFSFCFIGERADSLCALPSPLSSLNPASISRCPVAVMGSIALRCGSSMSHFCLLPETCAVDGVPGDPHPMGLTIHLLTTKVSAGGGCMICFRAPCPNVVTLLPM